MKRFQGRIPLVNTFGKASLHPVDGTPCGMAQAGEGRCEGGLAQAVPAVRAAHGTHAGASGQGASREGKRLEGRFHNAGRGPTREVPRGDSCAGTDAVAATEAIPLQGPVLWWQ